MSALSKFQKFTIQRVQRAELKNAIYNPRVIDDKAKAKLKKLVKKNGLVETLVWNKRTGNLVGGHQRISILDALEGTQDYALDVAAIDVDLKQEKELNIALNNPNTQGTWDYELLKSDAFKGIDWDATGFELSEISYFKADEVIEEQAAEVTPEEEDIAAKLENIAKIKEVKARQKRSDEDGEKFVVLTFPNLTMKADFLTKYGFEEDDKYIDAGTLVSIIKTATASTS